VPTQARHFLEENAGTKPLDLAARYSWSSPAIRSKQSELMMIDGKGGPGQDCRVRACVKPVCCIRVSPPPPPWGLGRYPWAPADALDLLRQMLAFFPEDRITAQDALAHPFFAPVRRVSAEVRPCYVHVEAVHSKTK
jgi:serine/threonine protein kinase